MEPSGPNTEENTTQNSCRAGESGSGTGEGDSYGVPRSGSADSAYQHLYAANSFCMDMSKEQIGRLCEAAYAWRERRWLRGDTHR